MKLPGNIVGLVLLALHTCKAHVGAVSFSTPSLSSTLSLSISFSHLDLGLFYVFLIQISKNLPMSCRVPKPYALSSLYLFMMFMTVQLGGYKMSCTGNIFMWSWCQFRLISKHCIKRTHDYYCHWLSHLNPLQHNGSNCTENLCVYCFEPIKTLIPWVSKRCLFFLVLVE